MPMDRDTILHSLNQAKDSVKQREKHLLTLKFNEKTFKKDSLYRHLKSKQRVWGKRLNALEKVAKINAETAERTGKTAK